MSLVRGLTTTGRTKRKVKFASAEAKRNHEQLQRDWESLKSKWGVTDKSKQSSTVVELPTVAKSSIRTTERPTSLNSWTVGAVSSKITQQYTGTKLVGIGTMHKSNAVPIFSDQEALEIATMRRN
jgi:hypothetical protein